MDTELCLKDLETVEKRREKTPRSAKAPGKEGELAKAELAVLDKVKAKLDDGRPGARAWPRPTKRRDLMRELFLLTAKPVLYIANVAETQLASQATRPARAGGQGHRRRRRSAERGGAGRRAGGGDSAAASRGAARLPRRPRASTSPASTRWCAPGYKLLGLQTYFTVGPKECRAWTYPQGLEGARSAPASFTPTSRRASSRPR